jgi:predicted patatin/cPLA2 family phospholipase
MKLSATDPRGRNKMRSARLGSWFLVLLAACVLFAYFVAAHRPGGRGELDAPVPAAAADQITVLGLPNARFWAWIDTEGAALVQEWEQSVGREEKAATSSGGMLPPANFLVVSGGGGDGSFGAGLICGWSDAGTMPAFKLVTGVSTGSLIAPFAYLGGSYVEQLRKIYTTISDKDVRTMRALNGLYGVVFGEALADTAPLYQLISRYVDKQMLADITVAYDQGRLLMIATASLDQQRPVLWNIGAIAASGHPDALELVRKIILASASIPGVFPPVMIDVEANGRRYKEMNVDAGVSAQMFLYPVDLGLRMNFRSGQFARERHAYLVRNGRLDPDWASVNRDFLTITERAIETMIHYLGYNDVLRIYQTAKRDGVDYNLALIETDFVTPKREPFDPKYMKALFDYAYEKGRRGYAWHKEPPLFEVGWGRPP